MIYVVKSLFNSDITDGLYNGFINSVEGTRIKEDLKLIDVPGAYDIPGAVARNLNNEDSPSIPGPITPIVNKILKITKINNPIYFFFFYLDVIKTGTYNLTEHQKKILVCSLKRLSQVLKQDLQMSQI